MTEEQSFLPFPFVSHISLFCLEDQIELSQLIEFLHVLSCRESTTFASHSFPLLGDQNVIFSHKSAHVHISSCITASDWQTGHALILLYKQFSCGVLYVSVRGQESAGIVTSNGANPPTYSTHKVTFASCTSIYISN